MVMKNRDARKCAEKNLLYKSLAEKFNFSPIAELLMTIAKFTSKHAKSDGNWIQTNKHDLRNRELTFNKSAGRRSRRDAVM